MSTLREDLKKTLDEAEWSWLLPHQTRGVLILVSHELDLLAVAEKVAQDSKREVEEWLRKGLLFRPGKELLEEWNQNPSKKFLTVIVQPWVLAQEHLQH